MPVRPVIDPVIATIAPGFRAISLFVDGAATGAPDPSVLADACRVVRDGGPRWADAHLAEWAAVYAAFGAKPNRTPCSAEALRRRVLKDGTLPAIDPVVDLYNAVSLRFAVPVGGEKWSAYAGPPRLTIATGDEAFDTVANGAPATEHPAPGEVIWRDDIGVTCRRWNWRQGTRTRIDAATTHMWLVLESLGTMPVEALDEAATCLESGLRMLIPDGAITREWLTPGADATGAA